MRSAPSSPRSWLEVERARLRVLILDCGGDHHKIEQVIGREIITILRRLKIPKEVFAAACDDACTQYRASRVGVPVAMRRHGRFGGRTRQGLKRAP